MNTWALGTSKGDWTSMAVVSSGEYDIPEGLIYSVPCQCSDGDYHIDGSAEVGDFSRAKMEATAQELSEERDAVRHLLG